MREYPTRPLESWEKAKELRVKLSSEIRNAGNGVRLSVQGVNLFPTALLAGIEEAGMTDAEPDLSGVTSDSTLYRECHEPDTLRGYKESCCDSVRKPWICSTKTIFIAAPPGKQVKPDLCMDIMVCPHQPKVNQAVKGSDKIPHMVIETPAFLEGTRVHHEDFLVVQLHDVIEWMEKTFKREYDDEKLIEATYTEWDVAVLYARIVDKIKHTPAPIDLLGLYPFVTPTMRAGRHRKEVKEICQMLLDELEVRVRDGIAVAGNERCRLLHEGNMPYFYVNMLPFTREYGAVMIGGRTLFGLFSAFRVKEDGTWEIPETPRERGIEIRSREDALRSLAELLLYNSPTISGYQYPAMARESVKVARDWKADGVIIHIDRGCRSMTAGTTEIKRMLEKKGIPAVTYEGNTVDPVGFNRTEVETRIEAFMNRLGLTRLSSFS